MATFSPIASRVSCGLLLLLLAGAAFGQQQQPVVIRTPPQNQTVAVGDTVSLTCGIDRSYDGAFLWITYVGSTMKNILFCGTMSTCRPSSDFPSDKYMTVASQKNDTPDSFTLNISKADLMDGARYTCSFLSGGDVASTATVVVIDKPEVTINEPDHMNPSNSGSNLGSSTNSTNSTNPLGSLPASSMGSLECIVYFGAPTFADAQIVQDRMPQLQMNFDGVDYFSNATSGSNVVKSTYVQGTARSKSHSLSLSVAKELTKEDIGKELTCTVTVRNPKFSLSNSVQYATVVTAAWAIEITPREELYYIDDVINCTVPEEPNANIRWESMSDPHALPIYSSSLTVKQDMVGEAAWKCVASDSTGHTFQDEFFFNVTDAKRYAAPGDDDGDAEHRRNVGLGVGLGLGLGLLVIIAIIILVIFLKRRKSPTKAAVKNGKQAPPATVTSSGYAPLAAEPESQVPPPIYQARTNAAPGRNTSPAPSEEPSLNRSGHGDLGFRPASLPSRSNSNLNASTERPLISLGGAPPAGQQPDSGPRPTGFADIGAGIPGRAPIPYADSHDSASAISVPHSTSIRSSSSSLNPSRQGPTYRQPAPRSGQATGV